MSIAEPSPASTVDQLASHYRGRYNTQLHLQQQQQQQQQRLFRLPGSRLEEPEVNNNNIYDVRAVYGQNMASPQQREHPYPVHSSSLSSLSGYATLPGLGAGRRSAFRPVKPPRKTTASVGELEEYARKFEDLYSSRRGRSGSSTSGTLLIFDCRLFFKPKA